MTEPTPLEMTTNEELVDELLRRATFHGIILRQVGYKGKPSPDWRWDRSRFLGAHEAASALRATLDDPVFWEGAGL